MQPDNFVQIEATLASGDRSFGTGYRVGHDRILTAFHVVEGAESILLRLDLPGEPMALLAAERIWSGEKEGLDAAVLAIDASLLSIEPSPTTDLVLTPPTQAQDWQSQGFSRVAQEQQRVADSMLPLDGKTYRFSSGAKTFGVRVAAAPENPRDWQGISGAPIFVGQSILGLISRVPEGFAGGRLQAVAMPALWARPEFRQKLENEEHRAARVRMIESLTALVGGDTRAATAVAAEVPAWREAHLGAEPERLVAAILLHEPVVVALEAIEDAHRKLHRSSEPVDAEAAATVQKLMLWIFPLLCERRYLLAIPGFAGAALLQLPVATTTLAEAALARAEGRAPAFLPLDGKEGELLPEGGLPSPPEVGFDFSGEAGFRDFIQHLSAFYLEDVDLEPLSHLNLQGEARLAEQARVVDARFRRLARKGLCPAYLIHSKFAAAHSAFIARLRKDLRALHILELTGLDLAGENELIWPLRNVLYRDQSARSDVT